MKKSAILILCFVMLLSFGACSPNSNSSNSGTQDSGTESLSEEELILQHRKEKPEESENSGEDEVIEITEKMFTQQINFIYYNPDEYLTKTITYEGLFDRIDDANGDPFYYVYRYGPGCCDNDANVGFEVIGDAAFFENLKIDDWVKVTGTVEQIVRDGLQYLAVRVMAVSVLEERGLETVS